LLHLLYNELRRKNMFGIRSVGKAISSLGDALSKFNQTIHGSSDAAAKTVEHCKIRC
jgi:hypothetical protein